MNQRKQTKPNRAFTLIEMIVALVLASVMMVGLLQIVLTVSAESRQLRREKTNVIAAETLASRLRHDLINSRGLAVSHSSLILSGYVDRDGRPGRVHYLQKRVRGRSLLIRNNGPRRELCWIGFGHFQFESLEVIDDETPAPELAGGLPPTPSSFRFAVQSVEGQELMNEVIHHHVL